MCPHGFCGDLRRRSRHLLPSQLPDQFWCGSDRRNIEPCSGCHIKDGKMWLNEEIVNALCGFGCQEFLKLRAWSRNENGWHVLPSRSTKASTAVWQSTLLVMSWQLIPQTKITMPESLRIIAFLMCNKPKCQPRTLRHAQSDCSYAPWSLLGSVIGLSTMNSSVPRFAILVTLCPTAIKRPSGEHWSPLQGRLRWLTGFKNKNLVLLPSMVVD